MSELWQIYDNIYLFPDEMQSKICAMLQAYIKCLCIIYTYEANFYYARYGLGESHEFNEPRAWFIYAIE